LFVGGAISCIAVMTGTPARAEQPTGVIQDIIVTGSRLAKNGQDAPSPVTVIGGEEIEQLSLTSAAEVLQELPQNSAFTGTQNVGAGNFNIGASLANLRGLNPFFGTRTLTLVNTRRYVPTTNTGAVDLNSVPSVLIQRIETVTGGGSAVYGSEAIAGVVNIILDTRLEGIKAQADYGLTSRGDGGEAHLAAAYGTSFAGARGRLVIGAEYNKADRIDCDSSRKTCADNYNVFVNPGYATNGQPHYVIGKGSRQFNSNNGLFPYLALQFNEAGTALTPFTPGNYADPFLFSRGQMQGGADQTQDQFASLTLRPESKRYTAFAHAEYDFSDAFKAWVEGSWYRNDTMNRQPQTGASLFFNTIAPDNAYLPPSAAGLLGSVPPFLSAFSTNSQWLPGKINNTRTDVWAGAFGLSGAITDGWSWDGYYSYGRNKSKSRVNNMKSTLFLAYALDAVDNPATPGFDPVCRVSLSSPTDVLAGAGCVPINLFGTGNVSPEVFDYVYRTLVQDSLYQQHAVAGSVRGDLFEGFGAGAVRLAIGGEYRHESLRNTHDLANQPWYSTYELSYGADFGGKLDAIEGYGEIALPIVKDRPFFKSLVVDGAVRQSHYKNTDAVTGADRSVDFTTWKLSGVWDVGEWLRFRITRSRDARAPSFYELYSENVSIGGFFGSVNNPWAGGVSQPIVATLGGTADETGVEYADTWTLGAVLTGQDALKGLYASIDWYQVDLKGPISTVGTAQNLVLACFNQGSFCDYIDGTGPLPGGGFSTITATDVRYLNLGSYTTRGLDLEVGYGLPVGGSSRIDVRAIGSYLYDLVVDYGTGAPVRDNAGISGPTAAFGYFNTSPKWQANAFLTYSDDVFTGTIQARYVGPAKFALLNPDTNLPYVAPGDAGYATSDVNSISSNRVSDAIYINLNASVKVPIGGSADRTFEFFGQVGNLFDKDAPPAPGGNGFGTNPVYFDTIGRSFRIGARVRY